MNGKYKFLGMAAAAAVIIAAAFYFFYWVKTPAYSLSLIGDAITGHDAVSFQQHVDMDRLYSKAYDDFLNAEAKLSNMPQSPENNFIMGYAKAIKPQVVNLLKTATLDAIAGQDTDAVFNSKAQQSVMAKNIKQATAPAGLDIGDVSVISQNGRTAAVQATLHSKKLYKDFTLNLTMNELEDGTWKLLEINNFYDFVLEVDAAEKAKLAELNAPIGKELANMVECVSGRMTINNQYGFMVDERHWLDVYTQMKNISGKDIANFTYRVTIYQSQNGPELTSFTVYNGDNFPDGQTVNSYRYVELDLLDPHTDTLVKSDFKSLPWKVDIIRVEFKDGSVTELYREVPDAA